MSDAEKLLANLAILTSGRDDRDYLALKRLLDAALSRARAEALEEAEAIAEACRKEREALKRGLEETEGQRAGDRLTWLSCKESEAERIRDAIRKRKSTPAPATIPVERVRAVLINMTEEAEAERGRDAAAVVDAAIDALSELSRRLGVDLDAKGGWTHEHERDGGPATHPDAKGDTTCRECGHPPHPARCVRAVSPQHSRGGAVAARACGCEAKP